MDLLQSVQFVTVKGERLAVVSAEEWEAMFEWLETLEDTQIAKEAFEVGSVRWQPQASRMAEV
jgi:PHD/YefM family antitoxin component YafN of YafNO toxin-antitoxin module